jgi:hypothetical protein
MNVKDEEPLTPREVLCELLSRSRLEMVEDLEEGESPPLYVNECFAQALIAQLKEDQDGKYLSPLEIVVPPYFSVGGVFVFVRNDMFPKAKNGRNFYVAAFKMPV